MSKNRIKTTITLPEELMKRLDEYAETMKMDRSHFLEFLLENALELMPNFVDLFTAAIKKKIEEKEGGETT